MRYLIELCEKISITFLNFCLGISRSSKYSTDEEWIMDLILVLIIIGDVFSSPTIEGGG